jgi:hypothetical protein
VGTIGGNVIAAGVVVAGAGAANVTDGDGDGDGDEGTEDDGEGEALPNEVEEEESLAPKRDACWGGDKLNAASEVWFSFLGVSVIKMDGAVAAGVAYNRTEKGERPLASEEKKKRETRCHTRNEDIVCNHK